MARSFKVITTGNAKIVDFHVFYPHGIFYYGKDRSLTITKRLFGGYEVGVEMTSSVETVRFHLFDDKGNEYDTGPLQPFKYPKINI